MITVADVVALLVMLIAFMVAWLGTSLAFIRIQFFIGKAGATMVSFAAMVVSYMLIIQALVVLEVLW